MKINGNSVFTPSVDVNYRDCRDLKNHLQAAFDILEETDTATFEAVDGAALAEDLDIYIRQIATIMNS